MVFEPIAKITRSSTNNLGRLDLNVQGQGFVFTENPQFNHGTLRLQATQDLSSSTRAQARFYYAPNQFLGNNEERQSCQHQLSAERFTGYIWSTRFIHDVTPDLSLRLLGRYGMHRYNEAFSERDTNFGRSAPTWIGASPRRSNSVSATTMNAGLQRDATSRSSKTIRPISTTICPQMWMWN